MKFIYCQERQAETCIGNRKSNHITRRSFFIWGGFLSIDLDLDHDQSRTNLSVTMNAHQSPEREREHKHL